MKPINYYTTVSEDTEATLDRLDLYGKLKTMEKLIEDLLEEMPPTSNKLTLRSIFELAGLEPNQSLGLIKALADQCQETLISK